MSSDYCYRDVIYLHPVELISEESLRTFLTSKCGDISKLTINIGTKTAYVLFKDKSGMFIIYNKWLHILLCRPQPISHQRLLLSCLLQNKSTLWIRLYIPKFNSFFRYVFLNVPMRGWCGFSCIVSSMKNIKPL